MTSESLFCDWQNTRRSLVEVWVPIAMGLLTVAGFFAYVFTFGVNVPYWDEWELLSWFQKFANGQLSLYELVTAKHNEHLVAVSYVFMLMQHLVTGFNVKAILITGAMLQVVALGVIVRFVWQALAEGSLRYWMLLPPVFMLLSLSQYQNLLWGFQTPWFMITVGLVLSLALLDSAFADVSPEQKSKRVIVAAIVAFAASFCSFHGLIVWLAGAIFLYAKNELRMKPMLRDRITKTWFIAAGICIAVYLVIYFLNPARNPVGISSAVAALQRPDRVVLFVLLCTGTLLVDVSTRVALGAGSIVLIVACVSVWRAVAAEKRSKFAFALALITYGLAFVLLVAVGRGPIGLGMSRESHYTAYAPLILVGSFIILFHRAPVRGFLLSIVRVTRIALAAFLVVMFVISTYFGVVRGYEWRSERGIAAAILLNYQKEPEFKIERALFGDAKTVIHGAAFLEMRGFSTFASGIRALPSEVLIFREPPQSVLNLIKTNPDMDKAIQRLWDVYCVGHDLQTAFNPYSTTFMHDLVRWAYGTTRMGGGGHYLSKYLQPYASEYEKLNARLSEVEMQNSGLRVDPQLHQMQT
jgi:hypothetical protein